MCEIWGMTSLTAGQCYCRRYLYITILREPTARYISEWMHVQRGATWMASQLRCKGHAASLDEVPLCYSGDWILTFVLVP